MNNFDLQDIKDMITNDPPPTGDGFLDARYDEQTALVGHPQPYYRLFYQIAGLLKPDMVVELGGWQGIAAAHFAAGGAGTVATIDHHSDPGDEANKAKMLEAVQQYANLFYFQGWTWDVVPDVKALGKKIDILCIDSWHMYQYAIKDWNDYSPLLADLALVIVDDIMPDNQATMGGMIRFWEEVSEGYEAFHDGTPHWGVPMGFIKWQA